MFPAAHLLLCSKAARFSTSVGLFINRSKLAPCSACQLSDELLITDLTRAEREKLFLEVPGLPGNDKGRVPARQPLLPRPIWHLKAPGTVAQSQFGAVAPGLPAPSLPPSLRSLTWALPAGRKYQGEPQLCGFIFGRERCVKCGWTPAVPFVLPLPARPIFAVVNLCGKLGMIKRTGVKTSLCELTAAYLLTSFRQPEIFRVW